MSISTVNSTIYSASTTSSATSASSSLSITSEEFLGLMVEQLQNQNPLEPTDTNAFIDRMLSYASYDAQTSTNNQLSSLVTDISNLISSNGLGYMGQTIEAYGNTAALEDGEATWGYSLEEDAAGVTITIKNEDGGTVWSGAGETEAGEHSFTWDGTTSSGTQLTDGNYTIEIAAYDEAGNAIDGYTTVSGTVTGVDSSSGTTMLMLGGVEVAIENVLTVGA